MSQGCCKVVIIAIAFDVVSAVNMILIAVAVLLVFCFCYMTFLQKKIFLSAGKFSGLKNVCKIMYFLSK